MLDSKPLWQHSATDLAEVVSTGRVSSRDCVESVVERVRATNGSINAIVDDLGEDALRQADEHDRVLKSSGPIGPLHGIPVTLKENVDQKGCLTPNGVAAMANLIAPDDSPSARSLKAAGAIIIGRTNTPEFSLRVTTDNLLHGRTFNPWNNRASAGGSSGGAAAATMMGYGPLAHGNDIGGSLRIPSFCCGAATVKPGLGRTPAYNPSAEAERGILAQMMSVQGVIAREVKDVRLGMKSMLSYDPHDPWMIECPFDGPVLESPIRVAFTKNAFEYSLHPAVNEALDVAADALSDAGYEVVEAEPPDTREIGELAIKCLLGEVKSLQEDALRQYGSPTFNAILDNYYDACPPLLGNELLLGMAQRAHHLREWTLFLQHYPLVLTPLLLSPTYDWDEDTRGQQGIDRVLGESFYARAFNFMGLPAGCVPAIYNGGLPLGVQIVGRLMREDLILDACEAIENSTGVMAHKLWAGEYGV